MMGVNNMPSSTVAALAPITATTAPTPLPSTACSTVLIQNDPASAHNLLVGDATNQPLVIVAGASLSFSVLNANLLYYKASTGTVTVNVLTGN